MSEKKRIFAFEERMTMIDSSILQDKKAAYFTLGCKLNFAETSSAAQALKLSSNAKIRFFRKTSYRQKAWTLCSAMSRRDSSYHIY